MTTLPAGDYTRRYDPDADFDRHITDATGRRIRRWLRPGDKVLELGCATGRMTRQLAMDRVHVVAVERAGHYVERARERALEGVTLHHGDIEDLRPEAAFRHVVATNLLQEVPDPEAFLRRCRDHLAPGGLLHLSVANPRSLHRLVAMELGWLDDLRATSDRGARLAARRMLDADELATLGGAAGLECVHREPVLLKPLTNAQLEGLPDHVVEGLDRVAHRFPHHGAMNYVVFEKERWAPRTQTAGSS